MNYSGSTRWGYFTTLFDGVITVTVGVVRQVVVGMAMFNSETVHIPCCICAATTSQFSCQEKNQQAHVAQSNMKCLIIIYYYYYYQEKEFQILTRCLDIIP